MSRRLFFNLLLIVATLGAGWPGQVPQSRAEPFGWGQRAGDGLVTLREALEEGLDHQGLAPFCVVERVSACLP